MSEAKAREGLKLKPICALIDQKSSSQSLIQDLTTPLPLLIAVIFQLYYLHTHVFLCILFCVSIPAEAPELGMANRNFVCKD